MPKKIILSKRLTRKVSHYKKYDIEVPKALLEKKPQKPDLTDFPYPLPQKKSEYTCFCEGNGGVMWYGSKGGVTRFDENADMLTDKVMYFGAKRDLPDNNVKALTEDGDGVWVLTDTGVTHIEMIKISMEEKADMLLKETLTYVDRHGMVSQKNLSEAGNLKSALPYGHSDNDGSFGVGFAIGEIFRYATLKREKGALAPETLKARKVAVRSCEANLLLLYISGRGNGFPARTYLTSSEPVPDDGLFYKKNGKTAVCINTTYAQKRKTVGIEVKADAPIPERLRKLYTSEGYTDTDITYKGDTSSDEITHHFLHFLVAHEFLGVDDPELDELIITAAKNLMNHIIENGFVICECDGKPTTWGKWNKEYFESSMGWEDACLNGSQIMMYLKATMHLTGEENGYYYETLRKLENDGYLDLATKHYDRFHQGALSSGTHDRAGIMFGDHMLAVLTYFGLVSLEKDEDKKELWKSAFRTWRYSLYPEFNPGYDFLYFISVPEDGEPDEERIKTWFYRFGISRLASHVTLEGRLDYPKKLAHGYPMTSALLPNDERFISKYDRDPLYYKEEDSNGSFCVESCYPFSFAYWIGRYFGFIGEEN